MWTFQAMRQQIGQLRSLQLSLTYHHNQYPCRRRWVSSIETSRSLPSSTHGQPPSTIRSTSSKTMEVESRKDAVLLAQIQSGHCISFKSYHHLMDPTVDPTCLRCGEEPQYSRALADRVPRDCSISTRHLWQREPPTQCSHGGTKPKIKVVF